MRESPNDRSSERALLGSILLDPDNAMSKINIVSNDFYDKRHQTLFNLLMEMYKNNSPMDMVTIRNYIKDNKKLSDIGGEKYLVALQSTAIIPAHVNHYQSIVNRKSNRRKLIEIHQKALDDAYDDKDTSDEVMRALACMKLEIQDDRTIDVLTEEWLEKCEQGKIGHMNWWCKKWDTFLGLLSQELMIFHAPRSTGKTALMLQWIIQAHRQQHRTPLASIEMLKQELCGRFVSHIGQVNSYTMRTRGMITDNERTKSKEAIEELKSLGLCIRDKSMTIDQICAWARSEVTKGVSCIFIDNLLSISDGGKQYQSKTIMYDHFIRELRSLRDSLSVPIILLAHPNEETGRVAWSKDVENFADIILYMANVPYEGVEINGTHIPQEVEHTRKHVLLKFQKNRQGISPTASAMFDMNHQTFEHLRWENV